jgi:hypothetical protein
VTPTKEPLSKPKVVDIDIDSIQEDIDDKQLSHDTNHQNQVLMNNQKFLFLLKNQPIIHPADKMIKLWKKNSFLLILWYHNLKSNQIIMMKILRMILVMMMKRMNVLNKKIKSIN